MILCMYLNSSPRNIKPYARYAESVTSYIPIVVCLVVGGVLVLIKIYKNRHFLFKRQIRFQRVVVQLLLLPSLGDSKHKQHRKEGQEVRHSKTRDNCEFVITQYISVDLYRLKLMLLFDKQKRGFDLIHQHQPQLEN